MRIGIRIPALIALLGMSAGCGKEPAGAPAALFFVDEAPSSDKSYRRETLPSLGEEGALSASVTLGDETQRALALPLPSRITFAAEIPADPVLDFATAAATLGKPATGFPVEFRVTVNAGGAEETAFEGLVSLAQRNQWLNRRLNLTPWAGRKVQITFAVRSRSNKALPTSPDIFPLWGNPVLSDARGGGDRPHIVLISVDCLRPDHTGVYGYERDTTPHLDEFARRATVFVRVAAASAWTLPTHISMFTGWMPSFHGASREAQLPETVPYLPDLLSKAGYRTDAVVSGAYLHQRFGFERGFHTYQSLVRPRAADTVEKALETLDRTPGAPHFLFVHLIDPHWRYLPPDPFVERFGPKPPSLDALMDKVPEGAPPSGPEEIQALIDLYDAEIAYSDRQIGRFLDGLRTRGLYEDAMVLITADHGEAFYEHAYWQHTETLYEEMVRIPLIVKWPRQPAPARIETHVHQLDIFPTLLEAAGLPPGSSQGRSLGQRPNSSHQASRSPVISETIWESEDRVRMKLSIQEENLKYIATFSTQRTDRFALDEIFLEELFDLARDPDEKHNLLPSPEAESFRRELRAYLDDAKTFRSAHRVGIPVELDEDIVERLRKLGYIQ